MSKKANLGFIILFFVVTFFPAIFAHREIDRISDMENRYYANPPEILDENGRLNSNLNTDFDRYISDNVRGRTTLVSLNSKLLYYLFGRLANTDIRANEEGEIFGVEEDHLKEYQDIAPYSESYVEEFAGDLERLADGLKEKGIDLYFCVTYDKENIYPERYIAGVNRLSDTTNGRRVAKAVERTSVKAFPIYELMQAHREENIYYKVADASHWNQYGAYLGFEMMIEYIRTDHPDVTAVSVDDYKVTSGEEVLDVFGLKYPIKENAVYYDVTTPKALECTNELDPEIIDIQTSKEYIHYYRNPSAGNNLKILLVNDSFIRMFIKDDFAEKFSETLSVHNSNIDKLDRIVEIYQPDIVLLEVADYPNTLNIVVNTIKEGY